MQELKDQGGWETISHPAFVGPFCLRVFSLLISERMSVRDRFLCGDPDKGLGWTENPAFKSKFRWWVFTRVLTLTVKI
jgi:hypothetical protein